MEPSGLVTIYCVSHHRDACLFTQQPPIEDRFILVGTNLQKLVPDFLSRLIDNVPEFAVRNLIEALEQMEYDYLRKIFTRETEERDFVMRIVLDLVPNYPWQSLDCPPDEYFLE
jgi:hypothetical protein